MTTTCCWVACTSPAMHAAFFCPAHVARFGVHGHDVSDEQMEDQ